MKRCPHCSSSEPQTEAGLTRAGSQRHKCRARRRVYPPRPKPLGYPDDTKREAVRLYLEGTNFRRIARVILRRLQLLFRHSPEQIIIDLE
jgi:transposase-like protein